MIFGLPEQLESKIQPEPNSGCWLWIGALSARGGYGWVNWKRKPRTAYKLIYELLKAPVAKGLVLDHLCRVTCCVNPDHMEPVTHQINIKRGHHPQSKRMRCPHGHTYDEENTYKNKNGHRWCRTCNLIRTHKRRGKL